MEKKQPKVEVSCNYCQTKFMKKASNLRASPISYCSRKCKGLFKTKNGTINLNCKLCSSKYCIPLSYESKSSSKFCSKKCYGEGKKTGFQIECNNCDNKFYRTRYLLKQKQFHFCSSKCHIIYYKKTTNKERINKNIKILKSIKDKYVKRESTIYRNKAISLYGLKCQNKECLINKNNIQLKDSQFDVDHIDGNRLNNNIDNLQVLCCLCHAHKTRILKNGK